MYCCPAAPLAAARGNSDVFAASYAYIRLAGAVAPLHHCHTGQVFRICIIGTRAQ